MKISCSCGASFEGSDFYAAALFQTTHRACVSPEQQEAPSRYIVENDLNSVYDQEKYEANCMFKAKSGMNTVDDLRDYLSIDPHPGYRLVSCEMQNGSYVCVWEKI